MTPVTDVKRLLHEPVVHFLMIGAALFLVFGLFENHTGDTPATITVTQGQIATMASAFTRTWRRPPTPEELDGAIQDRVREEIYYREAIALGLDRDDPVIRRHLREKLEFISDDPAAQAEPSDAELDAYLRAHPELFPELAGSRVDDGQPALATVRDAVYLQWAKSRRLEANERFYRGLQKKYRVVIEPR